MRLSNNLLKSKGNEFYEKKKKKHTKSERMKVNKLKEKRKEKKSANNDGWMNPLKTDRQIGLAQDDTINQSQSQKEHKEKNKGARRGSLS